MAKRTKTTSTPVEPHIYASNYGYMVNVHVFGEQLASHISYSKYNGDKAAALAAARKTKRDFLTTKRVLETTASGVTA